MTHKVFPLFYIIALMVIAVGAVSCSDPRTYDQYKNVSLQGWSRNDTLSFDIPRQWEGNYQLDLCLRAAQTYPYRNISMHVTIRHIMSRESLPGISDIGITLLYK
ncbi:MAG: hypothetical protein HXO50_11590 [Prevotella sp.]|nr:hypothetical protein [Prevotella sp.]